MEPYGSYYRTSPNKGKIGLQEMILTKVIVVVVIQSRSHTMRETWVQSLGQEDLLEKEMATDSSILAWKIPWTEKPGRLQSIVQKKIRHD